MHVESELGRGSTFEVYVPSSEEPLTETSRIWQPASAPCAGVILVAEDDPSVRRGVVTILRRAGYEVIAAGYPWEILDRAAEYEGEIDLLLTDVVMPVMSGKELAAQLTARRPELSVLYMSGYTDEAIVDRGVLDAGVHLLAKPITPERLLAAVGQRLDEKRASRLGTPTASKGAEAESEEPLLGL
jgi:CheY-like chemotaxis protein